MQLSIFDLMNGEFSFSKDVRMIELFAGYGITILGAKRSAQLGGFEHQITSHKICEWSVKSIQAYKDCHYENVNDDYTDGLDLNFLSKALFELGISYDYNNPMSLDEIKRRGLDWCKNVYNNIKITHNLVNVCNVKGGDLEVLDQDKYQYLMTYSFPCQDL